MRCEVEMVEVVLVRPLLFSSYPDTTDTIQTYHCPITPFLKMIK